MNFKFTSILSVSQVRRCRSRLSQAQGSLAASRNCYLALLDQARSRYHASGICQMTSLTAALFGTAERKDHGGEQSLYMPEYSCGSPCSQLQVVKMDNRHGREFPRQLICTTKIGDSTAARSTVTKVNRSAEPCDNLTAAAVPKSSQDPGFTSS
jgi:hypothetical protein